MPDQALVRFNEALLLSGAAQLHLLRAAARERIARRLTGGLRRDDKKKLREAGPVWSAVLTDVAIALDRDVPTALASSEAVRSHCDPCFACSSVVQARAWARRGVALAMLDDSERKKQHLSTDAVKNAVREAYTQASTLDPKCPALAELHTLLR